MDHISSLPDEILGYILSFVPTKSAVKTSVLSKRWQHMWTEVPALDFTETPSACKFGVGYNELSKEQKICFKSFVDRLLFHHDFSYLQLLRLHFVQGDDDSKFKSWWDSIRSREIRKIDIEFRQCLQPGQHPHLERILLPASILSAKELVFLKLNGLFAFDVSIPINLPKLEIIHLASVMLPDDEILKSLTLGCPTLKELRIIVCRGHKTVYVESSTLETLQVVPTSDFIVIKVPSLKYLFLVGTLKQHDIGDLPLLEEANIHLHFVNSSDALLFLRRLSAVKTLLLGIRPCFRYESNHPAFQNLTHFSVIADGCVLQILNSAPKLKSLIIEQVLLHYASSFDDTLMIAYPIGSSFERNLMPELLPCLEHVEFRIFGGRLEEMQQVAYFLEVGSALKEMKIITGQATVSVEDVHRKIPMLPRSSAACQVEIVHNG